MSTWRGKKRAPLSDRALELLRQIVVKSRAESRALRVEEIIASDSPVRVSQYNSLHVLADRWFVVIDGNKVRPRQAAVNLLRSRGLL